MGCKSSIRSVFRLFLLGATLLCLATGWACAPQKTPDLLTLHSVGPPTLEQGSELRIAGDGFPERRAGRLTLIGTVYAAARAPRKVSWPFVIVAETRTTISHRLSEDDLREYLRDAAHATFRGKAVVQFQPLLPGRPALSGTSETFELDLFSEQKARAQVIRPDSAEDPRRFEAYLGIELGDDLCVRELRDDSVAAKAGLQKGDLLQTLDNVHLDSRADFLPQPRANISTLEFQRPGYGKAGTILVPREDFQVLDPTVGTRALAILAGIIGALCVVARPPRFLVWLFTSKTHALLLRRHFLIDLRKRSQIWAYPTFLVVLLAYSVLLSQETPSEIYNLDFLACLTVGTLLVVSGAFVLGGARNSRQGYSLLGALSAALAQFIALLPTLLACTFRASELGTLRLTEMASAQGPWPHEWGALSSPWTFLLAAAALLALVPVAGRRAPLEGHVAGPGTAGSAGRILEWSGHLVFVGLWVTLFAGSLNESDSAVISGLFLAGKFTVVVRLLCEVRARTGQVRLGESGPLSVRLSWGLAVVAVLLGSTQFFVQGALIPYEWLEVLALSAGLAFAALLVVSSQRSWTHMGRRSDPWI